ncbi:Putative acetate efflux pump, MadN [Pseudoalteromonas luteoviolacea B = ATCC 29581]|nr:Putative acetate efflux pump, MadN [Pseudoalteromonas luteoviolacea B = ATCC 29581]
MSYLISITALWAFSFSLIGVYLAGQVDSWFAAWSRVLLACCVLVPFIRPQRLNQQHKLALMSIGAIQIGLMYGFYYQSFLYLSVPEVLLFTVMTPIYITLIHDAINKTFHWRYLVVALLAVFGAVVIRYEPLDSAYWTGILLVQGANLCFATGQVWYKHLDKSLNIKHTERFAWFFIGALIISSIGLLLFGNITKLPTTVTQWSVIVYLGLIASGVGYLAWNKGATLVSVGTLAVMNNALIPAGILVNILIWNKPSEPLRLALGSAMIVLALMVDWRINQSRRV